MEKKSKEIATIDKGVINDENSAPKFGKSELELLSLIAEIIVEYIIDQNGE